VDQPLHEPFAVLVEGLARLQVEEADQVDEQERDEEGEQDGGGARHRPGPPPEAVECVGQQEADRRQVGEEDRAGHVPLHLGEGGAERRGQEEEWDERALASHRPTFWRPAHRPVISDGRTGIARTS
jgi:hypothetical protein